MPMAELMMFDVTSTNSTTGNTGSNETGADLVHDRINLISATTLLGFTYGIVTILYSITTYFLLKTLFWRTERYGFHPKSLLMSQAKQRKTLFYVVYTSVLFVLATVYTACNSQNAVVAYVDNRLYPGGPSQYYTTFMASQSVMVITDVASLIILWMTDALILYRCVVFYYNLVYARWIILLPCAMFICILVFSTLVLQGEAGLGNIFFLSEKMLLAYYGLSFALSLTATTLIAVRLYWHKAKLERALGPDAESPYMGIATMLIESASLYGAWSLMVLIFCILNSPGQMIFLATAPHIQIISPLLIILRIARGKVWSHETGFSERIEAADKPPSTSRIGKLIFEPRPADVGDNVRPGTSRSTSRYTVAEGGMHEHAEGGVNVVELGAYGSRP